MGTLILTFLLLLLCTTSLEAQTPNDFRTEQVFIAPDKTAYKQNDTIKVNGFVTCMAHSNVEPYSRYVYLELINSKDSVIVRNKLPIHDNGTFYSSLPIDALYKKGTYFLRGYTRFMENFSHDSFGISPILIGQNLPYNDSIIDDRVSLDLIVPGQRLIADRPQQISCVLTNYNGFPIPNKTLTILDERGSSVAQAVTSASGYAHFILIPEKDTSYKVRFSDSGIKKEVDLPTSHSNKPVLNAVVKRNQVVFDVVSEQPEHSNLYLYEKWNGLQRITAPGKSGTIHLPNPPIGPITLFLTDENNKILSEVSVLPRLTQIGSIEVADTLTGGRTIDFSIDNLPTDNANVIARVVPEGDIWAQTAWSSLLFSDLSSCVPTPDFSSPESVSRQDIDAWLRSASFTRFNLKDIADIDTLFSYRILPEFSMELRGTVYDDGNAKHPMNKGTIVAYNNYDRLPFDTEVDPRGRFTVKVSDFPAGSEFFLQGINNKGVIKPTIISLDADTFPSAKGFSFIKPFARNRYSTGETVIAGEGNDKQRELPDVIIKARTQRDEPANDKRFYGVRFKSREQIEERQYNTLIDIIRDMAFIELRVVALIGEGKITDVSEAMRLKKPFQKVYLPFSKRGANGGVVYLLIDGIKVDFDEYGMWLDMVSVNFESVEQLSVAEAKAIVPFAIDGAINVKTRRLGPPKPKPSKGTRVWPMGLTITPGPTDKQLIAPEEPGRYKLMVDVISSDGTVESYVKPIVVE